MLKWLDQLVVPGTEPDEPFYWAVFWWVWMAAVGGLLGGLLGILAVVTR